MVDAKACELCGVKSPFKWGASWTGPGFIPNLCFATDSSSNSSSNQWSSALKLERKEVFLLLSRLLRKVATIELKIAVMIMYHSLKFSFQLGWVAQYLEVCKAAARNAGSCSLLGFPAATPALADHWHRLSPCPGTHPLRSGTLWTSAARSEPAELLPYGPNTHKVWHGLRKMRAQTQTCAGGGGENSKRFLTGPRWTRGAQLGAAL